MSLEQWAKDNWPWFGPIAAGAWGAYQWLWVQRRTAVDSEATRQDAASDRLWQRLTSEIDKMEEKMKALRQENEALHAAAAESRHKMAQLETDWLGLRRKLTEATDENHYLRSRLQASAEEIMRWRDAYACAAGRAPPRQIDQDEYQRQVESAVAGMWPRRGVGD